VAVTPVTVPYSQRSSRVAFRSSTVSVYPMSMRSAEQLAFYCGSERSESGQAANAEFSSESFERQVRYAHCRQVRYLGE
jgi:hypothetical protein